MLKVIVNLLQKASKSPLFHLPPSNYMWINTPQYEEPIHTYKEEQIHSEKEMTTKIV